MNYKHFISLVIVFVCLFSSLHAWSSPPQNKGHRSKYVKIENIVKDLSSVQKHKLEAIDEQSQKQIMALRAQKKSVQDSIRFLYQQEGDQSGKLYPLFEKEANLQVRITKEMYAVRLQIDDVLSAEQRKVVQQYFRQKKHHK